MNFLDLVIVGLLLLGGLNGYRNGLIKSVIGVTSTFMATFVAIVTYKSLTPVLQSKLGIGKIIVNLTSHSLTKPAANFQPIQGNGLNQVSLTTSLLPQFLRGEFNGMFKDMLNSAVGKTIHSVQEALIQYFSLVMISMLAFLLIFIVTSWLLRIVGAVLTKSIEGSFIGSLNHSGGFIIGLIGSLLVLSIMFAFVVPLLTIYPVSSLSGIINHSVTLPFVIGVFSSIATVANHIF